MNLYNSWPVILIVTSNLFYHIAARSTPRDAEPFLSLAGTYLTASAASFFLYLLTASGSFSTDLHRLNWTSWLLGLAVIGLETGFIFMYRMGWDVSRGPMISNTIVSVALVALGLLAFGERIGWQQAIGIILCLAGLVLINRK